MDGQKGYLMALTALVLAFAATVPLRGLFEPDESRYALVAQGMLEEGHWLVPHLAGKPYTHKPPLYLWLVALLRAAGIPWTAAGVLPAFLPALALLLLFPRLAQKVGFSRQEGLAASVALAASPFFVTMAVAARMDMLLVLFFSLALVAAYRVVQTGSTAADARKAYWVFWLSLGLAVMSKGPVALALTCFTLVLFAVVSREPLAWRRLFSGWGWLAAASLVLAWLVPAAIVEGSSWLYEIVFRQSAGRMVASFAHREPFYFHLVTWPLSGFPSSWLGLFAAAAYWRRREQPPQRFLAAAFLAVLLFFSLISGKLVVYLLPLVPISLLLATRAVREGKPWARWGLLLAAASGLFLGAGLVFLPRWRPELDIRPTVAGLLGGGLVVAGGLAILWAAARRLQQAWGALCAGGLWFAVVVLPVGVQALSPRLCVREVAEAYARLQPDGGPGLVYRESFSGLPLYSQRPFLRLHSSGELRKALEAGQPVVITERDLRREQAALAGLSLETLRFPYRRSQLVILRLAPAPGS